MKKKILIITPLYFMMSLSPQAAPTKVQEMQAKVELVNSLKNLRLEIDKMVELLEENSIESSEKLIRQYAIPEELAKQFEDKDKFKELVENFHEKKRLSVLEAFKATSKIEPEINEDKSLYSFTLPEGLVPNEKIKFIWNKKQQKYFLKN